MKKASFFSGGNILLAAIGAAAFFIALIAAAPASIAPAVLGPDGQNLSYANIEGTIWRGKISSASASGVAIGDISYRLAPLSLAALSPGLRVTTNGGAVRGEGRVAAGPGRKLTISDAEFDIDLGPFARRGILGEPVDGIARISVRRILLTRAGCREADAAIWTNVLNGPAKRFQGSSFPMAGDIQCAGNNLVIALAGESGDGAAELEIRLAPDLTYEWAVTVRPMEDSVASALKVFGFEDADGSLVYGSAGVLRGVGS